MAEPLTYTSGGVKYVRQYNVQTGTYAYVPLAQAQAQARQPEQTTLQKVFQPLINQLAGVKPTPQVTTPAQRTAMATTPTAKSYPPATTASVPQTPQRKTPTGGGTGGSTGTAKPDLSSQYADQGTLDLLKKSGASNVSYDVLYSQAYEQLKPYYERILKESNYDLDTAKARLEEDRKKQFARVREAQDVGMKEAYTRTNPEEMSALLESLGARGLLGTVTGEKEYNTYVDAQGNAVVEQLPTKAQYGGLASKRIELLKGAQRARTEALERARKQTEEDVGTSTDRSLSDIATERQRKQFALEQERRTKAGALGASRYSEAQRQSGLKSEISAGDYLPYI